MSEREVSLQHVVRRHGNQMVFFYTGAREAVDGLLTLPADELEWIKQAWISGYRMTPDGRTLMEWPQVLAEIERQSTKSTEDNKSVKDSNAGRQSETENRIRATEPSSSASAKPSRTPRPRGRSANNGKAQAKG